MMNKFWFYTATTVLLGAASAAEANYVIKLKNGNQYVTTRYWNNGQQVFFDAYGGVFGVDRGFVIKIDKASDIHAPRKDMGDVPVSAQPPQPQEKSDAEKVPEPAPKVEPQSSPKDPIVNEFNQLKERSNQVGNLLTSEILELLKEITAFKNKLAKDSKLFISYAREFNEAHEIADVVESALRSRTQ